MKNRIFKTFKLNKLVIVFLAVGFFSDNVYGDRFYGTTKTTNIDATQITSSIQNVTSGEIQDVKDAMNLGIKKGQKQEVGVPITYPINDKDGSVWKVTVVKNNDGTYSTMAEEVGFVLMGKVAKGSVSGRARPGALVTVMVGGKSYTTRANAKGQFKIKISGLKNGDAVTVGDDEGHSVGSDTKGSFGKDKMASSAEIKALQKENKREIKAMKANMKAK